MFSWRCWWLTYRCSSLVPATYPICLGFIWLQAHLHYLLFHYDSINQFVSSDVMRQYLQQLRQEAGVRVCEKVFSTEDGRPSKWWLCFSKKKFMDKSLSGPGQWNVFPTIYLTTTFLYFVVNLTLNYLYEFLMYIKVFY